MVNCQIQWSINVAIYRVITFCHLALYNVILGDKELLLAH